MAQSRSVYHIWAQGNGGHKRIGNCSYTDDVAYSYAAPIGKLMRDRKGKIIAVFVSSRNYSVTTAKHIGQVKMGCSHYLTFSVPHVNLSPNGDRPLHVENYESIVATAENAIKKAERARENKEFYYRVATETTEKANEYSKLFDLRRKPLDVETVKTLAANVAEKQKAIAAKQKRKHEKELLLAVKQFKEGGTILSYLRYLPSELLRVSNDGTVLETSKGVSIPLQEAIAILSRLREIADTGNDWRENGEVITVSDYRINSYVSSCQTFIAGCHKVKLETIETLARELGL